MTNHNLEVLNQYECYLYEEERSHNTIQKYLRDLRAFLCFVDRQELSKLVVLSYKEHLIGSYAPVSVNSILAAVNGFLTWLGFPQYKVNQLKIQREVFSKPEKELSQREYKRLIQAAEGRNNRKLALLIQTICATGIRVSELRHITMDALCTGRTTVSCKGKIAPSFCQNSYAEI